MTFIKRTAQQIWDRFSLEMSEHLFLFPSRRSMLYFKKEMVEAAGRNLWMPDCLTLEEWVLRQTDKIVADNITLTYSLYQAALEVGFIDYGFEEFYPLAQIILKDFEEVNMERVDPGKLWQETSALQDLSPQSPSFTVWEEMGSGSLQKRWLVRWEKLLPLYRTFTSNILKMGLSAKGHIYREVSENMSRISFSDYSCVHVVGFSLLSKSEIKILDELRKKREVLFYWNHPPQMDQPGLDAGQITQKMISHFGQDLLPASEVTNPRVEIISTNGVLPQMKILSQGLTEERVKEEDLAVVLPHPSLIDIFLKSFPDQLEKVNISLGYPLVYSPARSLIEWIVGVWEDVDRLDGKVERRQLSRLWSHIYMENYLKAEELWITKPDQLYFQLNDWESENPVIDILFAPGKDLFDPFDSLIYIVELLIPFQVDAFHREVLRYTRGRLIRIRDVLESEENISFVFLRKLLYEVFQTSSAPFRGEPMEGVQVLGVQEVQNLGFRTLFIPGMNEEVLPSGHLKSVIPFSLRHHFGLKDQRDQTRQQSYYLWSAILNADQVKIFYSNSDDLLGAKGVSRYIYQLRYGNLGIPVQETFLDFDLDGFDSQKKEIPWTKDRQLKVEKYLQERGLSPSALITYLRCSFQFYLTYVMNLKEDQPPETGLDARKMGTVIHDVMHQLYLPYVGRTLVDSDYEDIREKVVEVVRAEYGKSYPSDSAETLSEGVHWMEQEIVIRAVHRFLDHDRAEGEIFIERLEEKITRSLSTDRIDRVPLVGIVDRLDHKNGELRVVDYKTGNSDLKKRDIQNMLDNRSPFQNWQLWFYAYLMEEHIGDRSYQLGHYTLRNQNVFNPLEIKGLQKFGREELEEFEDALKVLIDEMLDPEMTFVQTENTEFCKVCPFVTFCERQEFL